jgi:DNA-binding LacI/PurR family transcriptional regulator
MGVKGAELILNMLNKGNGKEDKSIVFDPKLTIRESVREI